MISKNRVSKVLNGGEFTKSAALDIRRAIEKGGAPFIEKFCSHNGFSKLIGLLVECSEEDEINEDDSTNLSLDSVFAQLNCIACIRAMMDIEGGIQAVIDTKHSLENMCQLIKVAFSESDNTRMLSQTIDLLAATSLYSSEGHLLVLDAFDELVPWFEEVLVPADASEDDEEEEEGQEERKEEKSQHREDKNGLPVDQIAGIRFAALISFLDIDFDVPVRLSVLGLIIGITSVPSDVIERMYLREEMCCAGLVECLDENQKAAEEMLELYDKQRRQLDKSGEESDDGNVSNDTAIMLQKVLDLCRLYEDGTIADEVEDEEEYDPASLESVYHRLERIMLRSSDASSAMCDVMQNYVHKLSPLGPDDEDEMLMVIETTGSINGGSRGDTGTGSGGNMLMPVPVAPPIMLQPPGNLLRQKTPPPLPSAALGVARGGVARGGVARGGVARGAARGTARGARAPRGVGARGTRGGRGGRGGPRGGPRPRGPRGPRGPRPGNGKRSNKRNVPGRPKSNDSMVHVVVFPLHYCPRAWHGCGGRKTRAQEIGRWKKRTCRDGRTTPQPTLHQSKTIGLGTNCTRTARQCDDGQKEKGWEHGRKTETCGGSGGGIYGRPRKR